VARVDFNSPLDVLDGRGLLTCLVQRDAQQVPGIGVTRAGSENLPIVIGGFAQLPRAVKSNGRSQQFVDACHEIGTTANNKRARVADACILRRNQTGRRPPLIVRRVVRQSTENSPACRLR
jgi:hypothetical protein